MSEAPPPYRETDVNTSQTSSLVNGNQLPTGCSILGKQRNGASPGAVFAEAQPEIQFQVNQPNNARPHICSVSENVIPTNITNQNINASIGNSLRSVTRNPEGYSSQHFIILQETMRRREVCL